jgi:TolB-like protein/DNA-binding winged helix-turn-helix (wHTH) protein/Flp pilus assembly protein TadD
MNTLAQGFALEGLRVEPLAGLVSGPGGREKLDPKVMDVLVHMAEHAGQVVLREELLGRLWPGAVVTDDALTRCFYELRRGLTRAGGDERYRSFLETVPKRGYRLNASVKPIEPQAPAPEPARPARRRGSLRAAGLSALALAAVALGVFLWRTSDKVEATVDTSPHSIAVLPFLDMSETHDQGYLSDGVTEEILNHLSQSDNLRVISRTSSFALRNEPLDVPQIAGRLGVAYVLEGSVRKAGDRVRITAQLIDASTNSHVWSRTFDRSVDDLFAVQDEIAVSVASAVGSTLGGDRSARHMPASVEAYERFLQGEFHYHRRSPDDVERAADYYRQAIALDPAYARAWAALAGAYSLIIGETDQTTTQALRKLQGEAAHKAVELDPDLAVAHARLAQYFFRIARFQDGREQLRIAVSLDPADPLVLGFSSTDAIWQGDYAKALELWRRISAKDPLSAISRGNLGYMLMLNDRLDEALAESQRAIELNPAAEATPRINVARILIMLGRFDEAVQEIQKLPEGNDREYLVALLHRAPGWRRQADAALKRLAALPRDIPGTIKLAEVYVDRGQQDAAFDLLDLEYRKLERDRAARPRALWYFQDEMRLSPYFRALHSDPRWAQVATIPN